MRVEVPVARRVVLDHPLVHDRLARLRDVDAPTEVFRAMLRDIGRFLAMEIGRELPTRDVTVRTPMVETSARRVDERRVALVSVLRAGNGLLDPFLDVMPGARVGFVGLYRDHETLEPHEYYQRLPSVSDVDLWVVVDPMLATGGSAAAAIAGLKAAGATRVVMACLVACPEGFAHLERLHPDVDVYAAALDDHLNERGYIVPGLGDAGDRLYGTPDR
jgi:uracil phosphoribosyltransferase